MKKTLTALFVALSLLSATGMATATVLTFDDVGLGQINNGYGGLNWQNMYVLDATQSSYLNSGYQQDLISGTHVAYNGYGLSASVSDGSFDFNGAYLAAAWRTGLNVNVSGYQGGSLIYSQIVTLDYNASSWYDFNFTDIDRLTFTSYGGTDGPANGGTHFAIENFTFNEQNNGSAPVPEPATLLLMGAGMAGLGFARRKLAAK